MGFDLLKMKNSLTSSFLLKACDSSALNDALAFAKASLHTESLENHPDYLFISSCGKKTIGVDDVLPLIRKCSFPPVVADKIMVIIDDMEKLTVAAQNKLLLLLEENTHCFVIGIVHEDGLLLDTVKSRMRLLSYQPLIGGILWKNIPYLIKKLFSTIFQKEMKKISISYTPSGKCFRRLGIPVSLFGIAVRFCIIFI